MFSKSNEMFIKYAELKKWIESLLHGSSICMVEWNYRFTRGIREYTVTSLWANVTHIWEIFKRYIELEQLEYKSNYVKFTRWEHNINE